MARGTDRTRLRPGSVIRYSYLWADEKARGREEGVKDRPSLVLAISTNSSDGTVRLMVLATTHAPPANPTDAVPFPPEVKRRLGLDDASTWIVTTEANAFAWPGPDIRPIPGRLPSTAIFGEVPNTVLRRVARSYLANRQRKRGRLISRTE
jgi:hypothetical protein